jgi:hypothetical protein
MSRRWRKYLSLDSNMLTGGMVSRWALNKAVFALCASGICRLGLAEVVRDEAEENRLIHRRPIAMSDRSSTGRGESRPSDNEQGSLIAITTVRTGDDQLAFMLTEAPALTVERTRGPLSRQDLVRDHFAGLLAAERPTLAGNAVGSTEARAQSGKLCRFIGSLHVILTMLPISRRAAPCGHQTVKFVIGRITQLMTPLPGISAAYGIR